MATVEFLAFEELRWGGDLDGDALRRGRADVVLGSELMYFSTPIEALVLTVASELARDVVARGRGAPPFALLCHVYRDASLPGRLAALAAEAGLACFDVDEERTNDHASNSRLHVLCWERHVTALFAHMPDLEADARRLASVQDDESDDEAALIFGMANWNYVKSMTEW